MGVIAAGVVQSVNKNTQSKAYHSKTARFFFSFSRRGVITPCHATHVRAASVDSNDTKKKEEAPAQEIDTSYVSGFSDFLFFDTTKS
jgi:hypothetical protein